MLALVMPTIHAPTVLKLYRRMELAMPIFVVGDEQTPDEEVRGLLNGIGSAHYYSAEDQRRLGYESCDLLNWRHPGRRSIGYLQAIREGADIVVSADDDNFAIDNDYFKTFERLVGGTFDGLEMGSPGRWVDATWFLDPPVHHRGFPHQLWHPFNAPVARSTAGARIGVAAGLCLGDPDIDAVTRMVKKPTCMGASAVADAGFVVDPSCYSPFNSQNTAFLRELLPVLLMLTPYGRFDDIWCSYVAERVMREHGYVVHYGRPYVWQQRSEHSLIRDLAVEIEGMEATLRFVSCLEDAPLVGDSILDDTARLYEHMAKSEFSRVAELGKAWVRDAGKVLS